MDGPRTCLFVGIDFGTTFSGVAWSWSEDFDNRIRIVKKWPGLQGSRTSAKVPTKILYEANSSPKWGFGVPLDAKPLQWFKLCLLDENDDDLPKHLKASKQLKDARKRLEEAGKTAEQVVTDYLRLLWQHALSEMRKVDGVHQVNGQPLRVVITFPAIFPAIAQHKLRDAAVAAGITAQRVGGETILERFPEPEAAALAIMDDYGSRPVETGDIFVVCDAGGGTVDLNTLVLLDPNESTMDECTMGDGALCGSIFVDEKFDAALVKWVDHKRWSKVPKLSLARWKEEYWEEASGLKRSFDGSDTTGTWRLPMPVEYMVNRPGFKFKILSKTKMKKTGPKMEGHNLCLKRADMCEVFDPAIQETINLVNNQVEQAKRSRKVPQAIFLVGGFGQSPYLEGRLKEKFQSQRIEVRIPDNGWSAICRGALLRAAILHANVDPGVMLVNQPGVRSHVARMSYGIAVIEPFDETNPDHLEQDRRYNAAHGMDVAANQMFWFVKKGASIDSTERPKTEWQKVIKSPPRRNRVTITLLKCNNVDPPSRRTEEVRPEGDIVCNISTRWSELPVFSNRDGETWREVLFELEMVPYGSNVLEFAAYYNGQRQPQLKIVQPSAPVDPPPPYHQRPNPSVVPSIQQA